jgi:hypothetical protein
MLMGSSDGRAIEFDDRVVELLCAQGHHHSEHQRLDATFAGSMSAFTVVNTCSKISTPLRQRSGVPLSKGETVARSPEADGILI